MRHFAAVALLCVSVPAGADAGEWTAGTYALGYGLTDGWSIATSPWIDYNYNMLIQSLSLSSLSEFHFSKHWGSFAELGVLGMTFPVPYFHAGFSLFYEWSWGLAQLGASCSMSMGSIWYESQSSFNIFRIPRTDPEPYYCDSSGDCEQNPFLSYGPVQVVHPEIQVQAYF